MPWATKWACSRSRFECVSQWPARPRSCFSSPHANPAHRHLRLGGLGGGVERLQLELLHRFGLPQRQLDLSGRNLRRPERARLERFGLLDRQQRQQRNGILQRKLGERLRRVGRRQLGFDVTAPETFGRSLDRLKIFPLPTAVLLPGAVVPLHIFEPRYRKMVADALAGDRMLGLCMLEPGWEPDYHGRPRVRPLCGVGRIANEEKLPDGRFNIQLIGVARAEILEELPPEQPYRVVRARAPRELPASGREQSETLRQALWTLCSKLPEEAAVNLAHAGAVLEDPGALADVCCAALAMEAPVRQKVLEELSVPRRLQLALEVVGEALLQIHDEPDDGGQPN
jgi:uncharacterized protein